MLEGSSRSNVVVRGLSRRSGLVKTHNDACEFLRGWCKLGDVFAAGGPNTLSTFFKENFALSFMAASRDVIIGDSLGVAAPPGARAPMPGTQKGFAAHYCVAVDESLRVSL